MSFKLISAKLTSSPGDSSWSQIHDFKPDDKVKLDKRGHLIVCLSIKSEIEEVSSATIGREVITRLQEEYYGNLAKEVLPALSSAVEKVCAEFSRGGVGVEIAALVSIGNAVYFADQGSAEIWVHRRPTYTILLSGEASRVRSASGYPENGDVFVLGTGDFFSRFSESTISGLVSRFGIQSIVEQLAPTVHGEKGAGSLGVVFVQVADQEELGVYEEASYVSSKYAESNTQDNNFSGKKQFGLPRSSIKLVLGKLIPRKGSAGRTTTSLAENEQMIKRRKVSVSVGLVLLVMLLVSIVFGFRQKKNKDIRLLYEGKVSEAEHNLEEAKNLISLDPERARELFSKSKQAYIELSAERGQDASVVALGEQLGSYQESILGEYRVSLDLFVDLSLLTNDFSGDEMVFSDGTLYVLDKAGKKIVSVDIASKRSEVVAGPSQIESEDKLAAYVGRVFVQNSKGVFEVGSAMTKLIEPNWSGENILANAYAGNFYILDKDASKIYRYGGLSSGFSSGQEWLSEGASEGLSNIVSWTIDGTIWMLTGGGDVIRFSQGNQISFAAKGVYPELANKSSAIYTNEDSKYLYIQDSHAGRVVVINKEDGQYKAQYSDEGLKDTKNLVVSENDKKLIVLKDQKLFSIDLKHL